MCVPSRPCLCDELTSNRPRITISINAPDEPADQELLNLDLPPGLTLADLKGFVQVEANFPVNSQYFFYNGQPLAGDSMTLEQAGIKDDDMLVVMIRRQGQRQQPAAQRPAQQQPHRPRRSPQDDEIETTRLRALGDHNALRSLQGSRPELAAAVNDPNRWREEWINMKRLQEEQQREHQRQLDLLNADPFNVEAQAKIEEMIRQERVIENLQHAYEHNPEGKCFLPLSAPPVTTSFPPLRRIHFPDVVVLRDHGRLFDLHTQSRHSVLWRRTCLERVLCEL